MKKALKYLAVLFTASRLVTQLYADGYIVPNGVVSNFAGAFAPQEISVLHNPANPSAGSSYTGFLFFNMGGNTFQFDRVADVGVRVFFVSLNDPISEQTILANNYTESVAGNSYSFTTPFYVGLYTGNQSFAPPNGIYDDPLFGWARLRNVNGSIQILSSALEYQGGGIIAGTQTILPVPEPSLIAIGGIGVVLLGWSRLRQRRELQSQAAQSRRGQR